MRGKISLLAGGAVGYVLGTRAGRERYEQIRAQAQNFWNNPNVQEKASQAQDLAKEKAPILKDKVSDAASSSSPSGGQHRDLSGVGADLGTPPRSDLGSDLSSDLGGDLGAAPSSDLDSPYPSSKGPGLS
jgi:SLT domain-containing protein